MYPKLNGVYINKIQKSLKGKDIEIKNIIKLINIQSSEFIKHPVSNFFIKKSLFKKKYKTLNQKEKDRQINDNPKENKYLTLNEFFQYYNKAKAPYSRNEKFRIKSFDKEKLKIYNNIENTCSYDDDNIFKNTRKNFYKNKKIIEKRNNTNIKTENNNKRINLYRKYKSNEITKNENNKNEDINKLRRMNRTFNYKYKNIKFEDKTIQTTKIDYQNTINNKKSGLLNKYRIMKLKNNYNFAITDDKKKIFDEKTVNNTELNKPSILQFINKSDKNLYFKNDKKYIITRNINNNFDIKIDKENIKSRNEIKYNIIKNLSQDKNNKENSINKIKVKDISNFTEENIINEYKEKKNIYKNRCINIYTLLSLKQNDLE